MECRKTEFLEKVNINLKVGYELWEQFGFAEISIQEKNYIPDMIADIYKGRHASDLACACQCFYLFRKLHEEVEARPGEATLLGDYFFSRFSNHLIPIDSVSLTNGFSDYLKQEVLMEVKGRNGFDMVEYEAFLHKIPELIEA